MSDGEVPFEEALAAAAEDTLTEDVVTRFDPAVVNVNVFAHIGCERIERMLSSLADMFPENLSLSVFLNYLQSNVMGVADQETDLMQQWWDQMTGGPVDLIEATKSRDAETLLNADVDFLKRIGARDMYDDPDVVDEDREEIMKHVQLINEAATAFVMMPDEMKDLLTKTLTSIDTTQPLEMQTIFSAVASTVGLGARGGAGADDDDVDEVDASERLMGLATKMMAMVSTVGVEPLLRMCKPQRLIEATGCADIGELTEQIKDEARKCFDISDMPPGAIDAAFSYFQSAASK